MTRHVVMDAGIQSQGCEILSGIAQLNQGTTASFYYHPWHWIPASMPVWRRWLGFLANQEHFLYAF
jgi:hypothetical protein